MKQFIYKLFLVLASCAGFMSFSTHADEVQIVHDELTLNAELILADDKSFAEGVVLMTHGTLAHNKMEIMTTLQELFLEYGYSTLAINLGLGISNRQGPYDCATPHDHQHTDALDEIGAWLKWLNTQGANKVALLGHSRGGNQTAWFTSQHADAAVAQILIAPMTWDEQTTKDRYLDSSQVALAAILKTAETLANEDPSTQWLKNIDFLYCKDTDVTPATFLSYYTPDPKFDSPQLLSETHLPTLVVAGSEDTVVQDLGARISPMVDNPNIELLVIDGADHFFRDLYADDLVEVAVEFLGWHE